MELLRHYRKLIEALLALGKTNEAETALNELLETQPDADVSSLLPLFKEQGYTPRRLAKVTHQERSETLEELTRFVPMDPERKKITFKDVAGMEDLKEQARLKIILPFQKPELFRKFKKAGGGGILLFGPPGCGKTWFAQAVAGECDARFFNVGIHEILNLYVGNSERNLHQLFETARSRTPAILFIDEIDALGRRRDLLRHSSISSTINSFLSEMDGLAGDNTNLLVLGATNTIWDVDPAFKRPGRFDQVMFVAPPDEKARAGVLKIHLEGRPVEALDLQPIVHATRHFSGADLKSVCDRAADRVLREILQTGQERGIRTQDLEQAVEEMKPSTREWLALAENYVTYANQEGQYDDLKTWMADHHVKRRVGF